MKARSLSNLRISQRFSSWPAALVGIIIIKAVLLLAVKPGSFAASYSGISYFLLLVFAFCLAIRNGIRKSLGSRLFWVFLAIGYGLWALDQSIYLYYELLLHLEVPNTSVADPILFLHIVPFMAALAVFPHRNQSDQKPYRPVLDALLLLFFWGFLYAYTVFPYQYLANSSNYALQFDVLYATENLVLVFAVGIFALRAQSSWKSTYLHLFGASALYTLSSVVANIAIDSGGYVNGKLYGLGLTASVCWFVWIPLRAGQLLATTERGATQSGHTSRASLWAMLTVVVISVPLVWELFRREGTTLTRTFRLLVAIATIVCLACVAYIREHLVKNELASDLGLTHERLRLAMKSGRAVGWEWDVKTGRNAWFGDLQTMVGIPSDTYVGHIEKFHRLVHPEDRARISRSMRNAMQSHQTYKEEFRLQWPDGTVRWVASEGKFHYASNGDPERMLGMAVDITERKVAENKLKESEERLRLAAQAGRMYAFDWDAKTDVIVRSGESVHVLNWTDDSSIDTGRQFFARVHPDDRERYSVAEAGLTPENPTYQLSYRILHPDGTLTWLEDSGRALFDEQDRMVRIIGMVADVTERKQAEEARKKSEEKFLKAFHASPVAIALTGINDNRCIEVNSTFERLTGYRCNEVLGRTPTEMGLWVDTSQRDEFRKQLLSDGSLRDREGRFRLKDGSIRTGLFSADLIEIDGDLCVLAVIVDITERKQAEEALRESEERLRLAAQAGKMYADDWDVGTDTIVRSSDFVKIPGLAGEPTRLNRSELLERIFPEDRARFAAAIGGLTPEDPICHITYRMVLSTGQLIWLEKRARAFFDEQGTMKRMISMVADVTDHKLAEEALSGVSRRLIEAQERERKRIARELHDDVAQRLALVSIELQHLQQNPPNSAVETSSRVEEFRRRIMEISIDVQALSHELHSSKLEYLGIVAAIKGFCREFGDQQNVKINFESRDLPETLPVEVSLVLFRVLQEALNNAAKYSGVNEFMARLWAEAGEVHLTVSDLGAGFDTAEAMKGSGLGLTSMTERIHLVKGKISIDSAQKHGTTIHARVPLIDEDQSTRAVG
jgi:PAS domain S-box-containing protein